MHKGGLLSCAVLFCKQLPLIHIFLMQLSLKYPFLWACLLNILTFRVFSTIFQVESALKNLDMHILNDNCVPICTLISDVWMSLVLFKM